ncbi:MAG: threonine--tRNA ligase [Planctomycetota bacterium]|nr:MAG: threonine--tRNA ligase [Planctomycetota bacterium]
MSVSITLPDGSKRELPDGASGADLAADIGPGLAKAALAVEIDGQLRDLSRELPSGASVSIIKGDSAQGLEMLRHSTAHVMAQAVMDLFGKDNVRLGIGPTIKSGFYYDFDFTDGRRLKDEDLARIEKRMAEIIAADQVFVREEVSYDEALRTWTERDDRYKCDLIKGFPEGETISFYRNLDSAGESAGPEAFVDLCRGPHVPRTGSLSKVFFKLLSVAGAYWQGDENNPMMQRVYAACFSNKKDLKKHLNNLEEARKRDHRKLGKELQLFHFTDEVGPGLPLWLPKGTMILDVLRDFLRAEQAKRGYLPVSTPHIGRLELYKTSGHWQNYGDSMFPIMGDAEVGEGFALKPMNCPHHIQIYKSDLRSYRDLPLRLAEFGTVYRYEKSGELGGLKRVRGFTVDDAHLFVTPEQLQTEFADVVQLVRFALETFGLTVSARVGTRGTSSDGKFVGSPEQWEHAQQGIIQACDAMGLDYTVEEGEAAFYGPKLDFVITDALEREWQLGTAQVDYNLPERFDLLYTAKDGSRQRPIMIHRAPFGSLERLMGVLIEHYGGAFPLWLAPLQISVAPITDDQAEGAHALTERLRAAGLRVRCDTANEPIGAKIKRARLEKVPYVAILGPREIAESTVSVRSQAEGDLGSMSLDEFFERVCAEVSTRKAS